MAARPGTLANSHDCAHYDRPDTRPTDASQSKGPAMLHRKPLLAICLVILLADCSHGPGPREHKEMEALPLTQVSSEFAEAGGGRIRQTETMEISPLPDGTIHYKMTLLTVDLNRPSNRDERVMTDYVADKAGYVIRFFDKNKKFNALGESQDKGRLIHMWMPTAARKDGGEISLEGFPDPLKVSGPVNWNKWSVWKAQFRNQQYLYDVRTGFLVGNISGSDTWVLEQSTVPGLAP